MAYNVVLRRNGAKVGHFGPFGTKKQAIAQGQVLADDSARDVVVSVEPQRKKATTKRKNNLKRNSLEGGGSFPYHRAALRVPVFPPLVKRRAIADAFKKEPDAPQWMVDELREQWKFAGADRDFPKRKNPGRGTFKSKAYDYYTVAGGKLTSGHSTRKAALKKASGQKSNVKTAKQAQKYLGGRSLTSSASWHNQPRKNPARTRSNPASKSILKRIDLANKWIAFAQKHDIKGEGYFGSTWPVSITYTDKIVVSRYKTQGADEEVARVRYKDGAYAPSKTDESYNLNDTDTYSDTGVSALRHEINTYIIKAIKNGVKYSSIKIPASLR